MIIITNNHTINIKTDIYAWKSFNSFLKILKQFSVHSIRKMSSQYKNEYLLKIHPFYSSEIKNNKKKRKRKLKIYLDYQHLLKNLPVLIYLNSFHFFH